MEWDGNFVRCKGPESSGKVRIQSGRQSVFYVNQGGTLRRDNGGLPESSRPKPGWASSRGKAWIKEKNKVPEGQQINRRKGIQEENGKKIVVRSY